MKHIIFVLIIALTFSCKTTKTAVGNSFIPYLLPLETEELIYSELQKLESDYKHIAFTFYHNDKGTISIYLHSYKNKLGKNHILSNRKLFVNQKFYPLDFNTDQNFQIKTVNDIPIAEKQCAFYKPKRRVENETINLPDLAERRKIRDTKDCSLGFKLNQLLIGYDPIAEIDLKGNIIKE